MAIKSELTVGEVSERTGVAISALRFYEAKGLLRSRRNAGNQRRYSRDVLRRVSLIKVAQTLGLPLAEIKEALDELPADRPPSASEWDALATHWREGLDRRIAQLRKLRDHLDGCIGCGCLSMRECPLRNAGDRLSREGAGPRILTDDP